MIQKLRSKTYNLLRWSEGYFKTDMVYLVKGGSWLTFGQIIASISALLLSIAFANLLPKETYGEYKYVLSLAGIIGAFSLTGMGTAITQAVARGFAGTLRQGFQTSLKWSAGIIIVSFTGSLYYFLQHNFTLAISLIIIGIASPILKASSLYSSLLAGEKEFKKQSLYGMIRTTLPSITLFITILFTKNTIFILLSYFTSHTIVVFLLYLHTLKIFSVKKYLSSSTIKFSKHLSLMNMFGILSLHLDKILIFHYLGASELAIYVFATVIPTNLQIPAKILSTLSLPKLSSKKFSDIKKALPRKMFHLFLITALLVLLYIILAPYIYTFLFPQYLDSIIFSQVFILTILFTPTAFIGQAFTAHMKKTELYIIRLIMPFINILLMLLLLPLYGIWGAIIATLTTYVINSIVLFSLFKKN